MRRWNREGKDEDPPVKKKTPLYDRIREILESARTRVARSVNTTQVVANWLIGREIVEEEQKGQRGRNMGSSCLRKSLKLKKSMGLGIQ